jgi:D-alanyl-D-alanine carboxypeptidase
VLAENPELESAPGEHYAYSNLGYWLLGRVIEAASGRPYCDFVRMELFEPLGITPSELDCDVADLGHHARGHQTRWALLGLLLPLMTDDVWDDDAGKWARFRHLHMNGPAYGGIVGSARGYAKLLQELLQPKSRLFDEDTRALFFSEQRSRSGEPLPTTLGWHRGDLDGVAYYSKPGGGPGFSGNLRIYRDQGIATVFLSNRMRVSESAIQGFSDVLDREALRGVPTRTVRSRPGTRPPLSG